MDTEERATVFAGAARTYARHGWALVRVDGKQAKGRGWQQTRPDSPDLAAGKWAEWGRHWNIGVVCGPSGLAILDVDVDDDPDAAVLELLGVDELPETPIVRTGSGKLQLYFADPGGLIKKERDGFELRVGAHMCVLPPSEHPDTGRRYAWLKGLWEVPLLPVPEETVEFFAARENGRKPAGPLPGRIVRGGRHAGLLSLAGTMRARGLSAEEMLPTLLAWNERHCAPPKSADEVRALAEDVAHRYEPPPDPADLDLARLLEELPRIVPAPEQPRPKRQAKRPLCWDWLTAFETKPVVFLDRPFWQAAAFHLKVGRKGVGKGTSLADLAARFTRGELGEKRNVVWMGSEDSVSIDVKPRVLAAGGDPARIAVVKDWLQLPRDIDRLAATVEEVADAGLLVIDPVSNHIAGSNSNDETDVRGAIAHLNEFADRFSLVAVGVRHLTEKEAKSGLLAAILGSSAWVQVPRAVIALARDPHDDAVIHMQVVAGNRTPPGTPGRRFRIEAATVETDGGPSEVSRVIWEGESTLDVEELLAARHEPTEPSKSADARALILATLYAAPGRRMGAEEFDALIAEQAGVSAKTVRNLRGELGVNGRGWLQAIPIKDEFGEVLRWDVGLTDGAPAPEPDCPEPDPTHGQSGSGLFEPRTPDLDLQSPAPRNAGARSCHQRPHVRMETLPCPLHEGEHAVVKRAAGGAYLACGCRIAEGSE